MRRLKPSVRMIARNPKRATGRGRACKRPPNHRAHIQSFVDGMGSTTVLHDMWPLVREMVDAAACASFAQIADAIRLLAVRHHVIAEAAGAASVAVAMAGLAARAISSV